jgi:class 3 adenylate cyclase
VNACPSCGHDNALDARFCSQCGSSLAAQQPAPGLEERKVVTAFFADLVGFTSRAEQMDPEDVRALLSPYYARLRAELQRFGGTVEKFIGDAVVAVFGAPTAHEDDPERAVRAALAIRDWVLAEERIEIRIGVNTGEALVSIGAQTAQGEGIASGDVMNTAARLQAEAPVNGILVGERTQRATRNVIEYAEADAVTAKGKQQPVPAWLALNARSVFGVDVPHDARTELVGRDRELRVLRDALTRVLAERTTQLVTLVGVPGIGKSRLLFELSRFVDDAPDLISWRQGRSLPYGAGISYWALAEIVKAHAGILESDTAEQALGKLEQMTAEVVPDEAQWVGRHLAALIGVDTSTVPSGVEGQNGEAWAAWRRFFETVADRRPLILVFEDLHWADDGMLDFVDQLIEWVSDVPLLVVCTARPELLDRRAGWGGGKPNAVTHSLSQLSDEDTARLIGNLLGKPLLDAETQRALLLRAGGNPLYAEQYAQMVGELNPGAELSLPDSVQGIIGARLDSLPPGDKQLLQDAAVIGKVFWPGAVGAVQGGEPAGDLGERLHVLERKQFVRRERQSTIAGESQYAFTHVLMRDVVYSQIPRPARITKHVGAAGWLTSLGRVEDHAEMLAHHYAAALDLARATGREIDDISAAAYVAFAAAGDRARTLNSSTAAIGYYRDALGLCPPDPAQRADLEFRLASTLADELSLDAEVTLDQVTERLLAIGDRSRAAEAQARAAAVVLWSLGVHDRCFEHLGRAEDLVRDEPLSTAKAVVLHEIARCRMVAGHIDLGSSIAALEAAERSGIDQLRADALITHGAMRALEDPDGAEDIRRGLTVALQNDFLNTAVRGYSNLGASTDDNEEQLQLALKAQELAERLGSVSMLRWTIGNCLSTRLELGDWAHAIAEADVFLAKSAEPGPNSLDGEVLAGRATIRLARDDVDGALADQEASMNSLRLRPNDVQILEPCLATCAYVLAAAGETRRADELLDELPGTSMLGEKAADFICAAEILGREDWARSLLNEAAVTGRTVARAEIVAADWTGAAAAFDAIHANRAAALMRLRAARAFLDDGDKPAAADQLARALAFFRSVGATRFIRETEQLLPASA